MRRTLTFPVKWEKGASVLCPRLFLPVLEQRRDQQWPMNSVNDTSPCPPSAHSSNLHAGKGTKSEKEDSVPSPCHVLFPLPLLGLEEGIPGVWGSTLFSFLTPQQIPACTSAVGLLCYTLLLPLSSYSRATQKIPLCAYYKRESGGTGSRADF